MKSGRRPPNSLQKSSQAQANKMQILGSRSHTHTTITLLSKLHGLRLTRKSLLASAVHGAAQ